MSSSHALFNLDYTLPPDGDKHRYARNFRCGVFTTTAQRAIEVLLDRHPAAVVHSVQRASAGTVIYDPRLTPESSHE